MMLRNANKHVFLFRIQHGSDESYFFMFVVNQLNLFVLLGFDLLPWCLQLRNLKLVGRCLRRLGCALRHPDREVDGLGNPEAFLLTSVCGVDIASDCETALFSRHLEHQIRVVWYRHELSE